MQDSTWKVKTDEVDNCLTFYVVHNGEEKVLFNMDRTYFAELWPIAKLEQEAARFKNRYQEITGVVVKDEIIKDYLTSVIEKNLLKKLNNITIDNERLKSFLLYHVKTLRSIKKYMKMGIPQATNYIDNELYNITNINIGEFFKILDGMTEKRKEKTK